MAISDSWAPNITDGSGKSAPMPYQSLTAAGNISIASGFVSLDATASFQASIDAPPSSMTGALLVIGNPNGVAHKVKNVSSAGFNNASGSTHATFPADNSTELVLRANAGVWYRIEGSAVPVAGS